MLYSDPEYGEKIYQMCPDVLGKRSFTHLPEGSRHTAEYFCPENIGYFTITCKDVGGLCLGEPSPSYTESSPFQSGRLGERSVCCDSARNAMHSAKQ